jgi:hypothetical protein
MNSKQERQQESKPSPAFGTKQQEPKRSPGKIVPQQQEPKPSPKPEISPKNK